MANNDWMEVKEEEDATQPIDSDRSRVEPPVV